MVQMSELVKAYVKKYRCSTVPGWFENLPMLDGSPEKNSYLALYSMTLFSGVEARCEDNTKTGTLVEGFSVLDETTAGEGSCL